MAKHFLFDPADLPNGSYWTPLTGEVTKGRIYKIEDDVVASVLRGHAHWKTVNKEAYDTQKEEK